MTKAFLLGKLPFAVRGRYDFWDVRDAAEGPLSCSESGEYGRYICPDTTLHFVKCCKRWEEPQI